jgi:transposase-like protein
VDESYFGPRRVRGRRGRGSGRKVAVIGLLKRKGKVFSSPIMNCSKAELIAVIRGQVLPGESTIDTDGWRAYDGLVMEGYKARLTFFMVVRTTCPRMLWTSITPCHGSHWRISGDDSSLEAE